MPAIVVEAAPLVVVVPLVEVTRVVPVVVGLEEVVAAAVEEQAALVQGRHWEYPLGSG